MKLVYLAHPYGGQRVNLCNAMDLGNKLTFEYPDIFVFNAVPYFRQFRDAFPEKNIMERCLDMVRRSDELWLAPGWTNSEGCVREYMCARAEKKPVRYL